MIKTKGIGLIVILGLIICIKLYPQPNEVKLNQIGIEQGLSQTTVFAITEDKQGFMWFGTDDGLNRYDGYSVTVFKHNNLDSNSIADNSILALQSDKDGNLWIGTRLGGVDRYVPEKNKFFHYRQVNDTSTINDNTVYTIYQDLEENIWIGTNQRLKRYDREKNTFNYFAVDPEESGKQNILTRAICEDKDKILWIGTSNGLYQLDLTAPHPIIKKTQIFPDGTYIYALHIDNNQKLLIGTYGKGLYRYDKVTNVLDKSLTNSYSNAGNFISSILEDYQKTLWIAAYDSGLAVFDSQSDDYSQITREPVMTLFQDKSNVLWIGTFTDGVKMYDSRINRFKHYYNKAALRDNNSRNLVTTIMQDMDGMLWIGTYGSGLDLYSSPGSGQWNQRKKISNFSYDSRNPNSISSDRIVALSESDDGLIWIGTENDGLDCLNKKSGQIIRYKNNPGNINTISSNRITNLFYDISNHLLWIGHLNGSLDSFSRSSKLISHYNLSTSITTIYKKKNGALWVGTFGGDLYKFNPTEGSFIKMTPAFSNMNITKNGIYSIYEDNEGIIWLATHGSGLIRFDPEVNSIKNFTENNGLPNNSVYGVLNDKDGNLWLSTNKGLAKFDTQNETVRNYDAKDGLQSNEFNQGAYFKSTAGELFFGGINGFNAFFPEDIKDNQYLPPVYITSVKVFDKILPLPNPITSDQITLSYYQNFFSFEFVALNYTSPEKVQYAYMLEGFDKNWHRVSAQQRYAGYTNLDPGKYFLHVKAANNDGVWNNTGASIAIKITPPFWMEWWFRVIMVFILSIFGIGSIRYFVSKKIRERTRKLEQETAIEHERTRIARDMHDDLGAKITEISILSELAKVDFEDKKSSMKHIEEISLIGKKVVKALDQIVWSVNPKNDTLESLIDYIVQQIEQFLSLTGILYRLDIPSEIPPVIIPFDIRHNVFLVIQEALNNIVKHAGATEVNILMTVKVSKFYISVRDNGKGFNIDKLDSLFPGKKDFVQKEYVTNKAGIHSNGLGNMKKRIEETGGVFVIETTPGKGTEINIEVPLGH